MSCRRRCPRWDLVLGLLGRRRSWSVKHNCFLQFHSVQMVALATAYINSGDYDVSLRYNYETVDEKYNHERERKRETKEWIERRPMQLWLICSYCYLIVVWPFFSRGMEIYIYIYFPLRKCRQIVHSVHSPMGIGYDDDRSIAYFFFLNEWKRVMMDMTFSSFYLLIIIHIDRWIGWCSQHLQLQ